MTGEDAPAGEPGELLIRGPQVMKGYLNNPHATALAIDPDGWLHTGDVARIEENGSLRIVDRIKELIKYKGYQIAPAELEALLLTHPAITDAAVIPLPDEEAGEVPKAFVVTNGSITPEEVSQFVADHVAPVQESARRRDHRRDPEGAVRQDPAPRADRARADRGRHPVCAAVLIRGVRGPADKRSPAGAPVHRSSQCVAGNSTRVRHHRRRHFRNPSRNVT